MAFPSAIIKKPKKDKFFEGTDSTYKGGKVEGISTEPAYKKEKIETIETPKPKKLKGADKPKSEDLISIDLALQSAKKKNKATGNEPEGKVVDKPGFLMKEDGEWKQKDGKSSKYQDLLKKKLASAKR